MASPVPALPDEASPAVIRDGLVERERVQFEQAYRAALAQAAETLDLAVVLDVLRNYHRIARLTAHHGHDAHRRMLVRADGILNAGGNPDGAPLSEVRERIRARLGE